VDAKNLTGAKGTEQRRDLDFYPTPPECTIALLEFLKLPPSTVWEPACGEFHMSRVIEAYGHKVVSTDINTGTDFLKSPPPAGISAIITNPPFFLAQKFIKKSIEEAPLVAMLLKSQYWHSKSRLKLYRDNQPTYILPLTWRPDFLLGRRGGRPTMEVCWTVWIDGDRSAKYIPLQKPSTTRSLF